MDKNKKVEITDILEVKGMTGRVVARLVNGKPLHIEKGFSAEVKIMPYIEYKEFYKK
jgi:siroheme synthase